MRALAGWDGPRLERQGGTLDVVRLAVSGLGQSSTTPRSRPSLFHSLRVVLEPGRGYAERLLCREQHHRGDRALEPFRPKPRGGVSEDGLERKPCNEGSSRREPRCAAPDQSLPHCPGCRTRSGGRGRADLERPYAAAHCPTVAEWIRKCQRERDPMCSDRHPDGAEHHRFGPRR